MKIILLILGALALFMVTSTASFFWLWKTIQLSQQSAQFFGLMIGLFATGFGVLAGARHYDTI